MSRQETLRRLSAGFIGLFVILVTLAIANAIAVRFMTDAVKPQQPISRPADKPAAAASMPSPLTELVEPDMPHDSLAPQVNGANSPNTVAPARPQQR